MNGSAKMAVRRDIGGLGLGLFHHRRKEHACQLDELFLIASCGARSIRFDGRHEYHLSRSTASQSFISVGEQIADGGNWKSESIPWSEVSGPGLAALARADWRSIGM